MKNGPERGKKETEAQKTPPRRTGEAFGKARREKGRGEAAGKSEGMEQEGSRMREIDREGT